MVNWCFWNSPHMWHGFCYAVYTGYMSFEIRRALANASLYSFTYRLRDYACIQNTTLLVSFFKIKNFHIPHRHSPHIYISDHQRSFGSIWSEVSLTTCEPDCEVWGSEMLSLLISSKFSPPFVSCSAAAIRDYHHAFRVRKSAISDDALCLSVCVQRSQMTYRKFHFN